MEARLNISQITKACGGTFQCMNGDEVVYDVRRDSREVSDGSVFVALRGENFDAHDFVCQALENGALCAVVDCEERDFSGLPIIRTKDTLLALGSIARLYREQFNVPVIAVTGSVGKTSTKDLIAEVFKTTYNTIRTDRNFNNEIGVPLMIFRINAQTEIAILEMGMRNAGEISYLSNIAKPDTAVITNIGLSHIENLRSKENILKAKLEVTDGLRCDGCIVLNGDDELLYDLCGTLGYETLYYGIDNPHCDIIADDVKLYGDSSEFTLKLHDTQHTVRINSPGKHHVYNALAALLCGMRYNIPFDKMIKGIADFKPGDMRQNIVRYNGYTVIEDCYNAGPDSMRAGLDVLIGIAEDGSDACCRRVAILGDMLELGEFSEAEHRKIGCFAAQCGVDVLITVGKEMKFAAEDACNFGMDNIYTFATNTDLINEIEGIIKYGDCILIKGSRGMKLELISNYIKELFG